ncbi:MAG TPA: hypothetical protein VKX49_20890 [Bryobacteraceae bacterium]|nr:hypothetical protein [Bryobacteraceae bacterium]
MSPAAKDAFGDLVLHNDDCYAGFFGLFTGSRTLGSADFRRNGQSATWKRISDDGYRRVILSGSATEPAVLSSPTEIKSILYGVRYWATKELTLIDEFFRDDRGTVMYPIMHPGEGDVQNTIGEILAQVELTVEWTTLALAELAETCCEKRHRPLETLRMAIRQLVASHPGQVVTVPTSRAFATITAGSRQREELELRVYFRDAQNRYVSHVKIHKSLSGRKQWRAI